MLDFDLRKANHKHKRKTNKGLCERSITKTKVGKKYQKVIHLTNYENIDVAFQRHPLKYIWNKIKNREMEIQKPMDSIK